MGSHFQDFFWAGNGFEELNRYMKTGTDFCKDLESLFSDRADLENQYANGLQKILKKARKSSKRTVGSIEMAWVKVIASLESEVENHRVLSVTLSQDGSKVMKAFTEQQVKTREPAVSSVEKQHKHHVDKYRSQLKNKRTAFKHCRDLESSWEQLKDFKSGKSVKPVSEKDIAKLEKTCRKLEESLVKTGRDYRDSNLKTEESRLSWENSMYKSCNTLETLEYERIHQVQSMLLKYCDLLQTIIPPIETLCQEVVQAAEEITPDGDIEFTCSTFGTGPNQPEQLLLDCYEEDFHNSMDNGRRGASLEKKIQYIEEEIERQQRAKKGVEQLAKVYQEQPDFTDEKGADDVTRQLIEADALLNMLKANHFKLLCSHAEISNAPKPSSHFADYISSSTDKHGQPLSILRIPIDQISDVQMNYEPPSYTKLPRQKTMSTKRTSGATATSSLNGRGAAIEDSGDDYVEMKEGEATLEFDDRDDEFDNGYDYVGQCKALFDYTANQEDELSIQPGDVINIIEKYDAEWWQGEIDGDVGIFPASYVEDI